jgi:DNA-binding NtrC family response regulator
MAKSLNLNEENGASVVIVEDESESRKAMSTALRRKGYSVEDFSNGAEAIEFIQDQGADLDVVITDLRMPGVDGLQVLKAAKQAREDLNVILVTAFGSVDSAVEAMKLGADDYLTKPVDLFEFRARVQKLIRSSSLTREVENLQSRLDKKYGFEQIVGHSASMEKLFEKVRAVAATNANVLITGESGTGKELIANAIHQNSKQKNNRFLPINCAAIPADILESELFGHERGAFTGAVSRKIGKFETATQGTIFLDEIGDMSMDLQVKLLRVLENREFMRVGGSEVIKLGSRFVFATNKNLEEAIEEGEFREDLYYRINVVKLEIPPLRQRREDIPLLMHHYLREYSEANNKPVPEIAPDVMDILLNYPWPGNVRELKNVIENVAIFAGEGGVTKDLLPATLNRKPQPGKSLSIPPGMTMDELEKEAIYQTLELFDNNKTRAAEALNIGLRTLQRKLKDYESEEA